MTDNPRTPARDLLKQAADAGVAPMLLNASPWAIRQDVLPQIAAAMRLQNDALATMRSAAPTAQAPATGVVTIPLTGIITPQGSFFDFLFGGAPGGLLGFREQFREALASPDVSAILIDVDSPGGLVDMVPETAAEIRAARGQGKRIVAVADTVMCSAAYWLASQADEIVATTSATVGSIGVYRMHQDWSVANAQMGIAYTYISAGRFKVEGNPDQPLDDTAREAWQADVQEVYEAFVADVATGRGTSADAVIADYGEGRSLSAARALEAGMVDRVATYDEVRAGLAGVPASGGGAVARARADAEPEPVVASAADDAPPEAEADEPAPLSDDEREMVAALLLA